MTEVIPLSEQIRALHPETGEPVTIVGIDTSSSTLEPRLVVLHKTHAGIYAEIIESADLPKQ